MDGIELVSRWMEWLTARGLSPHSIRLYRTGVVRFLTEFVGDHPSTATERHLTAFLGSLGKNGPARTQYLRALQSFFGWCHKRGWVKDNPTSDLKAKKPKPRAQVALTQEELYRIFCAAWERSPRRAWAIAASFGLGTRRSELAGLSPDDVNGDQVLLRNCKGGKQRHVEIGPLAKAALEGLRPWYNGTVLGGVKPSTLTDWALQAATDAGLREKVRGRTHHVLRASFATHLLRNGTPVHVVRDLMGHDDISTTSVYLASWDEDRREAVGTL